MLMGGRRPPLGPESLEQRPGFLQVGGVEAFGEPAVDRRQQCAGVVPLALALPEATEARRGPQLPGFGLLVASNVEGLMKAGFRFRVMLRRVRQE